MLNWASRFNIFCLLDNNQYQFDEPAFEWMMAVDAEQSVTLDTLEMFASLKSFHEAHPGWLFGHLNYPGAVNELQGFPAGFFFTPRILLRYKEHELFIETSGDSAAEIFALIMESNSEIQQITQTKVAIESKVNQEQYVAIIEALKAHIQRGDCYEINFCMEYFSRNALLDPLYLFHQLNKISPNPFAAFYKLNDQYCLCASPERFLKKMGTTVTSQPIKGTSKRDLQDAAKDAINKNYLLNSAKEKSENVMVVDLVRNDLSKICTRGSVTVKELFGIYSFPQVHQMISTIQGRVDEDTHWTSVIETCFPMGSMTGAPKVKVMQLIDQYETSSRGLFSGTIGYVTPSGDVDFNVVIRSIFYNASRQTLSFMVGSGITIYCDPVLEYEECNMKAEAIRTILEKKDNNLRMN